MAAMNELAPGPGHNRPLTLVDELLTETRALATEVHDLVVCADERAEVTDNDTAERATQLLGQMKDKIDEIEAAREKRGKPFYNDWRTVNQHFGAIMLPLAGPDPKKQLGGAYGDLHSRVHAHRRAQEVAAEAERQRLEAEARKQREAAEAAQRAQREAEEKARQEIAAAERRALAAAQAAQQARTREEQAAAQHKQAQAHREEEALRDKLRLEQLSAQLAERLAGDQAAKLDAQAAATHAHPIDSGVGPKAVGRRTWTAEIGPDRKDLEAAIIYCLDAGFDRPIREAVAAIYHRLVNNKDGARILPGAEVKEVSKTTIRRK